MSNLKFASIFVFLASLINEKDSKNAVLKLTNKAGNASCAKHGREIFINIPPFDAEDEQMVNLAKSFAVHESGHMKYTDYTNVSKSQGFLGTLENCFEDARIEQILRTKYAGAHRMLVTARHYLNEQAEEMDTSKLSDENVLFHFIYDLTFASNGYMSIFRDSALANKAELFKRGCKLDWLQGLNDLILKNRDCKSTQDVKDLAQEVITYLGKEDDQKDEDQKGQNQNGSSNKEQDDTASDDSSSSNQNGQDQDNSSSSDQNGQDQDNSSSSDQNGQGSQAASGFNAKKALENLNNDSNRNERDLGSALKNALSTEDDDAKESTQMLDSAIVNCIPNMVSLNDEEASTEKSMIIAEHAQKASAGLKRSLRGLIQAKHELKIGAGKRGKRLVGNAVSKLIQHDYRVFRTSQEVNGESTHFHFLLDISGSMSGERETATFASTMALINAMKGLPFVKTSAYAFGLSNKSDIAVIKTENQNERACLKNLSKLSATGGTPLSEGLLAVWTSAAHSKATRNVIIVITDGRPDGAASAKKIIEDIRQHDNVELCAIGIKTSESVMEGVFGRNYGCIDSMEELPSVMFQIAKANIL